MNVDDVWQSIGAEAWLRNSREAMETEEIRLAVNAAIESIAPEAGMKAVRPDAPLREQVDLDSMDWLNFLIGLHEKLKVEIPEADYARLVTLGDVLDYLRLKLK